VVLFLRLLGRIAYLGAAALLAIMIVQSLPNQAASVRQGYSQMRTSSLLGLLVLLLVALGSVAYWYARRKDFIKPSGHMNDLDAVKEFKVGDLSGIFNEVALDLSPSDKIALCFSILTSWLLNQRVTETAELEDTRIRRKVLRLVDPPGCSLTTRFVPVLRHRKGILVDELMVKVNRIETETVPYGTNVSLSILVLQELFCDAVGKDLGSLDDREESVLLSLQDQVAHPLPRSGAAESLNTVRELDSLWRKGSPALDSQRQRFNRVYAYFADYYVIFAAVPDEFLTSRLTVECAYSEPRAKYFKGISNRTRRWLGIPTSRYRVPITEAFDSVSYHFRCMNGDGFYLYGLTPIYRTAGQRTPEPKPGSRIHVSPTYGMPIAHFYGHRVADFWGTEPDYRLIDLSLDMEFRPVPPGLSAPIALLSAYLSIIVSALAVWHDHIFPQTQSSDGPSGNAVLSLVLALPALMSGWVASRFDREGLRQATPNVIFELLSLLTISILAVGVAAFKVVGPLDQGKGGVWFLTLTHPTWAVVWILALTHTATCFLSLTVRIARYETSTARGRKLRNEQTAAEWTRIKDHSGKVGK
jgi:hypothetical protein